MEDTQDGAKKAQIVETASEFFQTPLFQVRFTEVEVPRLGVVRLRSLSDREHTEIVAAQFRKDGTIDKMIAATQAARFIAACVVDSKGNHIFKMDDIKQIRNMDASTIEYLLKEIRKHVGIEDPNDVKDGEEGKNG